MKIQENFHVKGILHNDKCNRMKVYTSIFFSKYVFQVHKTLFC